MYITLRTDSPPSHNSSLCLQYRYLSVCITADRAGGERLRECFLRKTKGCAVPSQSDILYILWINPIHTHTWRVAQSLLPLVRPGGGGGGHIPNLLSPDSATRKIFATNGSPPTRSTHRRVCVQEVGGVGCLPHPFPSISTPHSPLKTHCHTRHSPLSSTNTVEKYVLFSNQE